MKIKNILLSQLTAALMLTSLHASECVDLQTVNVGWTSYKTMAKIGVSGTFNDVKLLKSKDTSTINSALVGTSVDINMQNINAKAAIKTSNILKFFTSQLSTTGVRATIIKVGEKSLALKLLLNGRKQIIPMKYSVENGLIEASGFIDVRDFGMGKALRNLNKNVAAHRNKGWSDIAINFKIIYTNKCK
jgi:hypothetical protein